MTRRAASCRVNCQVERITVIAAKPFIVQAEQGQTLLFVPAAARRLSRRSSRVQRGFSMPSLGQPFYGWSPFRRSAASSGRAGAGVGKKIGRHNGRSPSSWPLSAPLPPFASRRFPRARTALRYGFGTENPVERTPSSTPSKLCHRLFTFFLLAISTTYAPGPF